MHLNLLRGQNVTILHFFQVICVFFALVPLLLLLAGDNDTNFEIASKNVMPARMLNVYVPKKLTRLTKLCIFTLLITVFLFCDISSMLGINCKWWNNYENNFCNCHFKFKNVKYVKSIKSRWFVRQNDITSTAYQLITDLIAYSEAIVPYIIVIVVI